MRARSKGPCDAGRACAGAVALLLALVAPVARGLVWSGGTSALLGMAADTNPLEAISASARATDSFARFETAVWARGATKSGGPSFGLRWGADRYLHQRTESRVLVSGRAGWRRERADGSVAVSWSVYSRAFPLHPVRDAVRHEARLVREHRLGSNGRWRAGALGVALDGRRGGPRSRRSGSVSFELEGGLAGPVTTRVSIEGGLTGIDRSVLESVPGGQVVQGAGAQRDRWFYLGAAARSLGPPYLEAAGGVRRVRSNSVGFSFSRFEGRLLLAQILPRGVSGQLLATLEQPLYDDTLAAIDPLEDAEDRELSARSGVTLRLLRPLAEGFTGEFRAEWQRNESLILRDFYEKTVVVLAIRYGAGEAEAAGF
jgi:hypothetical protein